MDDFRALLQRVPVGPMTICVGAICRDQDQPAVVVASDQMVSWVNLTVVEHREPTSHRVGSTAVAFIVGDALTGTRMANDVAQSQASAGLTVEQLADALAIRYVDIRLQSIEADLLQSRGLTLHAFYQKHQQLLPSLVGMLDQQMLQYELGVDLLVAGVDVSGGHLFTVSNPGGRHLNHRAIGHAAIGSGMTLALQSMIGFGHASMQPLNETIFRVYASKRRAELAPGAGIDTDLMVVSASGAGRLTDEALDELGGVYADVTASTDQALENRIQSIALPREDAFDEETSAGEAGAVWPGWVENRPERLRGPSSPVQG